MPVTRDAQSPAWTAPELARPHEIGDKPGKVRRMFAAIASSYDLNNRLHSLGRDQAWRRAAVRAAQVSPGDTILDVACGTGDLTQAFASTHADHVTGLDFTREMLAIAERKRAAIRPGIAGKITYIEGDALMLPFPNHSFDVVSIAFGIRNVADPTAALREFARVLKPGGRLVVLEFDRPRAPILSRLYDFYCGWLMPRTATLISRDRSGAYRYLPRSVETFMSRSQLLAAMNAAGFQNTSAHPLTLGICVCYRGERA